MGCDRGSIKGIKPANIPSIILPDTRPRRGDMGLHGIVISIRGRGCDINPSIWWHPHSLDTMSHNASHCHECCHAAETEWGYISDPLHDSGRSYSEQKLELHYDCNTATFTWSEHLSHFPVHVATSFQFQFCIAWVTFIHCEEWCLCLMKIYSRSDTVLSIRCLPTGIMTWN